MNKNWLIKSYMKLPLAGKVIAPLAVLFLASALFKLFKTALVLGLIGLVAYVILNAMSKKE